MISHGTSNRTNQIKYLKCTSKHASSLGLQLFGTRSNVKIGRGSRNKIAYHEYAHRKDSVLHARLSKLSICFIFMLFSIIEIRQIRNCGDECGEFMTYIVSCNARSPNVLDKRSIMFGITGVDEEVSGIQSLETTIRSNQKET